MSSLKPVLKAALKSVVKPFRAKIFRASVMEPHPTVTHSATSDLLPCGCTITYSMVDGHNVTMVTRCKADCALISIRLLA